MFHSFRDFSYGGSQNGVYSTLFSALIQDTRLSLFLLQWVIICKEKAGYPRIWRALPRALLSGAARTPSLRWKDVFLRQSKN